MNLVTPAIATGVIVYAGRVAQGKKIDLKIAVGAGAFAIGLSMLSQADDQLATRFALLVLFGACLIYIPDIAKKTGLVK